LTRGGGAGSQTAPHLPGSTPGCMLQQLYLLERALPATSWSGSWRTKNFVPVTKI